MILTIQIFRFQDVRIQIYLDGPDKIGIGIIWISIYFNENFNSFLHFQDIMADFGRIFHIGQGITMITFCQSNIMRATIEIPNNAHGCTKNKMVLGIMQFCMVNVENLVDNKAAHVRKE